MSGILKPKRISYLVLLGSCFFFAGSVACPGFGDKTLDDLIPPVDSIATWDSDISDILVAKCASCHASPSAAGAPASFRLDRYDRADADDMLDGAFEKRDRIQARALDTNTMPPSGSPALTDAEKSTIDNWLKNGAQQTDSGPSWNTDIGAIISAQCGSCHSASPGNGVPTSFRLDIYNRVDGGGSLDGAFEKLDRIQVRALDDKTMPPGSALSAADQAKIQAWINAGAPLD